VIEFENRRLYLCTGVRYDMATFLPAVLRGGVDIVQLREKVLPFSEQGPYAREMVAMCRDFGVPFFMNDDPHLAVSVGADGVHVGQDDLAVSAVREIVGNDMLVGLSTHALDEFAKGLLEPVDYLSAGPLLATPTKPGREGTGLEYAVSCQRSSDRPVFITGGVSADTIGDLVSAGLRHFVVVRALTQANDPYAAALSLRRALDGALAMAI
jgi:thiamine-phosphate pyrophosphorylase